jgi:hypothetical protein
MQKRTFFYRISAAGGCCRERPFHAILKDMSRIFLAGILLALFFPVLPGAQTAKRVDFSPDRIFFLGRNGPIDVNLIIDGSPYMGNTGAQDWICGQLLEGTLQKGDYLRIWIAGEQALIIYQGLLTDDRETIKDLIRKPLPGSASVDFAGALRAARETEPGNRVPLMTYTLLVSSPRSLSPAHTGGILSYLRYSRVVEFAGWRALVIALDIGQEVREAADSFLSNR